MSIINAPFTEEQVKSINEFQRSGYWHPFTCGSDNCNHIILIVNTDGFECPRCKNWHQTFCHDFMADYSWKLRYNHLKHIM